MSAGRQAEDSSVENSNEQDTDRNSLTEQARSFLQSSAGRFESENAKRSFLLGKGLDEQEINNLLQETVGDSVIAHWFTYSLRSVFILASATTNSSSNISAASTVQFTSLCSFIVPVDDVDGRNNKHSWPSLQGKFLFCFRLQQTVLNCLPAEIPS